MTKIDLNWKQDTDRRGDNLEIVDVDGHQIVTGSRSACWAMLASCVASETQPAKPTQLAA